MKDNYLNATLVSSTQNDSNTSNSSQLHFLINATDEVLNQYPKSVAESMKEAFKKKKNKVTVLNGEEQLFLIALPKTDPESLRLAGASVFQALKNENCKEVMIDEVKDLTELQRFAFEQL